MYETAFCRICGSEIMAEAEICPKCGVRQYKPSDKSKTTAGILAILLGGLGIHKFYMGKPLQGILYLLFCWTFIPAIVSFIEGLMYFFESDEKFQSRLN
jgi:TM2 domain-containing membrane protein YozV